MYLSIPTTFATLLSLTIASNVPHPQHIFSNASPKESTYRIPTVHESAVQARRILRLEKFGTLSTVFPSGSPHANENRPDDVSGIPIGLMDYFSNCERAENAGNPTILAITIATSFKNVASGSNITLSLRWHNPSSHVASVAGLPRFSLIGYLEDIPDSSLITKDQNVPACFIKTHPDAAWWLPGNRIHESKWVRLVVREVYWIGGFGDRAYIGWIPSEEWNSVTEEEIEAVRLPGEKSTCTHKSGWKSWLGLGGTQEL